MADFLLMKDIQPTDHLLEDTPDLVFFKVAHGTLSCVNLSLEVATICKLHYNAQRASSLFIKGLFVASNVGVVDGREDTHLIDGVIFFLAGEFCKSNLELRVYYSRQIILCLPFSEHILRDLIF